MTALECLKLTGTAKKLARCVPPFSSIRLRPLLIVPERPWGNSRSQSNPQDTNSPRPIRRPRADSRHPWPLRRATNDTPSTLRGRHNPYSLCRSRIAFVCCLPTYVTIQDAFNLHFTAADAVRFVPVQFGLTYLAVGKANQRDAFELSPPPSAELGLQAVFLANREVDGNCLHVPDFAKHLKSIPHRISIAPPATLSKKCYPLQRGRKGGRK